MLSFEEDFQDVYMLPRSARKVSQVLNSFLIFFFSVMFLSICCGYNNTQRYFSIFLLILFAFWILSFHMAIILKLIKESNIVQD